MAKKKLDTLLIEDMLDDLDGLSMAITQLYKQYNEIEYPESDYLAELVDSTKDYIEDAKYQIVFAHDELSKLSEPIELEELSAIKYRSKDNYRDEKAVIAARFDGSSEMGDAYDILAKDVSPDGKIKVGILNVGDEDEQEIKLGDYIVLTDGWKAADGRDFDNRYEEMPNDGQR